MVKFFFNSLNKMTNAACENAMRRCPRKLMINFHWPKSFSDESYFLILYIQIRIIQKQ